MEDDNDIGRLARTHGARALEILADVMEHAVEERDVIRAAEAILDRGHGKPSQAIIAIPASRRQQQILASYTDDQLVAVIEQKKLPRLGAPQPMITVPAATQSGRPRVSTVNVHGPLEDESALDPLLL